VALSPAVGGTVPGGVTNLAGRGWR